MQIVAPESSDRAASGAWSVRRVLFVLLAWDALLLLGHALLQFSWRLRYAAPELKQIFRVSSEDSLVTWTSVVTMSALGVAVFVHGVRERSFALRAAGVWFLFLSLDDEAQLHERFGRLLGGGGVTYGWVVSFLPVYALVGVLVFALLWRATRTEPTARRGLVAAHGLWALAVLLEIPEKHLIRSNATWSGLELQHVTKFAEEGAELVAPALLLASVLSLLERAQWRRLSSAEAGWRHADRADAA